MASTSTAVTLVPPMPPGPPLQAMAMKLPAPVACLPFHPAPMHALARPPHPGLPAMDIQRAQMLDLRFRYSLALQQTANSGGLPAGMGFPGVHPFPSTAHDPMMAAYLYGKTLDPRARFFQEEPKPCHSYIGLIAMALLSSKDKKLILGDIYQWILDNYPYFRARGPGWRNSIRHNLSLNDCFIKSGRAANGKGHYWAIHPANVDDFTNGDFRRRRAQRKVRKAMGLDVPDEEDSPSPPPGPEHTVGWRQRMIQDPAHRPRYPQPVHEESTSPNEGKALKRGFDMASLLAPEAKTSPVEGNGRHSPPSDSDLPDSEHSIINKNVDDDEDDVYIDVDSTADDDRGPLSAGSVKRKLDMDEEADDSFSPARKVHKGQDNPDSSLDNSHSSSELNLSGERDFSKSAILAGSMWSPRPFCPPGWTPARPSAFYPNPFLSWGGLSSVPLPAVYGGALQRQNLEPPAHQTESSLEARGESDENRNSSEFNPVSKPINIPEDRKNDDTESH